MKNAVIFTVMLALCGCGVSTRDKEAPKTETKAVIADTGTSTSNSGLSNTSPDARRGSGDADDVGTSNRVGRYSDSDDLRSGTRPANANRTATRRDADDRGKPDSDDDD